MKIIVSYSSSRGLVGPAGDFGDEENLALTQTPADVTEEEKSDFDET